MELKLYKPYYKCPWRGPGEDCAALRKAVLLTVDTVKALLRAVREAEAVLVLRSPEVYYSGYKPSRTWLLLSDFSCSSHLQKTEEDKGEISPSSSGSCVCGHAVRCLLLGLPVGEGLQKSLRDICWFAHPSGNIYLFVNLFYEDCTGYMVPFFTGHSLFRVYKPWLDGKCNTTVYLLLLEQAVYCKLLGKRL